MSIFDDTRAAWGARSPKSPAVKVAPARRTEFFNHYDGGHPLGLAGKPHSACLAQVKADQAFHMNGNGWSDIGYNGLVCQHGRAIEGRGIDAIGAHCPNHNTTGYGFQFMIGGNESPTPAAFARMAKLYADCTTRSGHPLAKKGHRDGYATACPGDIVEAWVKAGMRTTTTAPEKEEEFMDVKNPVTGEKWPAEKALWSIWTYAYNAARDAAVALSLAKAQAKVARPLTADETAAAVEAGLDAVIDSAAVNLNVTQEG